MIQDIFPHQLKNQYLQDAVPRDEDFVLVFRGTALLMKRTDNNSIRFPNIKEIACNNNYIYLFQLDLVSFYLFPFFEKNQSEMTTEYELLQKRLPEYEFVEIREIRSREMQPKENIFAAITGKHLMDWYRDTKFCGRCGCRMQHSEKERAMICTKCGYTAYPRIMPAVIVGVINQNKLLLTKYKTGYQHNALIAGFTEIGETLEETVAREVFEEAGIHVKNIRYYKSQPWGLPNDILVGFYCEVDGDTRITMDEGELKYAEWVEREEIVLQPDDFSLTNEMMRMFKEGKIRELQ